MAFPLGWQRSCPLVIPRGKVYAASLANFPVYVPASRLPSEMVTLGGTNAAQSNGGDIRFSSDAAGQQQLACEVVVWAQNATPANAKAEIWVKAPELRGDYDDVMYVWYKPTTTQSQPAANAAYGSQAVWSSAFGGVWHFGTPSSLVLSDSTSNANNGTGVNSPAAGTGQIGGALALSHASNQYSNAGSSSTLNPSQVVCSAWVKATSFPASYNAILSRNTGSVYVSLYVRSDGKLAAYVSGTTNLAIDPATTALSTGTWYHVVLAYSLVGGLRLYINGTIDKAIAATGANPTISSQTWIGADPSTAGRAWDGLIDEARVYADNVVSSGWIATEYANQSDPTTFVIPGTPYAPGAYATPGGFYGG